MATTNKHDQDHGDLMAPLSNLISKGRKDGMLTTEEIMSVLEKMDLSPDRIEEIYDSFESMGIQVMAADPAESTLLPALLDDDERPVFAAVLRLVVFHVLAVADRLV